jgi:hypothetical protein
MEKSITVAKSYNHKDIICLGLGLGSCGRGGGWRRREEMLVQNPQKINTI